MSNICSSSPTGRLLYLPLLDVSCPDGLCGVMPAPVRDTFGRRASPPIHRSGRTVDWRPPTSNRFDGQVANDVDTDVHADFAPQVRTRWPGWVVPVIGALIMILLAVMAGRAMAV